MNIENWMYYIIQNILIYYICIAEAIKNPII